MKRQQIWGTPGIAMLAVILIVISGHGAWAHVPATSAAEPVRAPAATRVVTSTADSGPGTLRQALLDAVHGDTITFDPTVFPPTGPVTIVLTSGPLPAITQGDLTIDASNAGVVLDGSALSSGNGFYITSDGNVIEGLQILYFPARGVCVNDGAQYNTIGGDSEGERNVISGNSFAQVNIQGTGTDHNVVSGNYIGTDASGLRALGGGYGVRIEFGAQYNVLGGTTLGERNLISGNGATGVVVNRSGTMSNTVVGNLIGTDATGTAALGNDGDGVGFSLDSQYNRVEGNVISGNHGNGVWICDSGTMHNVISSNYVGTDASGAVALGNAGDGVYIGDEASNNLIGGSNATPAGNCAGDCNLISGNGGSGVFIEGDGTVSNTVSSNYIGTDSTGTAALPNRYDGVWVSDGARHNVIGPDNLISGNGDFGRTQVRIEGVGTDYNLVIGNHIGTDRSGLQALGGGYGVRVEGGAQYNVIGGTTPGERNLISGNGVAGVIINQSSTMSNTVVGNFIGTDATGTAALGNDGDGVGLSSQRNRVEGNVISGNQGSGVGCGSGAMYNVIRGNYIGTDVNGTTTVSNSENGIYISGGASHNLIGGSNATPGGACSGECNLISGNNDDGIEIEDDATNNIVSGNYIGTDVNSTTAIRNGRVGVRIDSTSRNLIGGDTPSERNLISGNGEDGVQIEGSTAVSNTVSGNYIGTDVNGTAAIGNGLAGVYVRTGAQFNLIGGSNPDPGTGCSGECNLISGNGYDGVAIRDSGTMSNTTSGNYIGTDVNGTIAVSNSEKGIYIGEGASHNLIGGSNATPGGACAGDCNLISGNGDDGVRVEGSDTISNTVSGNYVGTDVSGTVSLPNGNDGVHIEGEARYNLIGGNSAGERNLFSGNSGDGVQIVHTGTTSNTIVGNYIGTDASGTVALGNEGQGVRLSLGTQFNKVDDNVISGNYGNGVAILDSGTMYNVIRSNYIGTDVNGTTALSNNRDAGIFVGFGASYNLIGGHNATPGGACTGDCNLISGQSGGESYGVQIEGNGTMSNTVSGNYIGTDVSGTVPIGNENWGILIVLGPAYNVIGGDTASERNVISGNGWDGISVNCVSDNRIIGNYIGTDASGTRALGNAGHGIFVVDGWIGPEAVRNLIKNNLVSGNGDNGIALYGTAVASNTMSGNRIGTNASGTAELENRNAGIWISGGAHHNIVGGSTSQDRNIISGNNWGVAIEGTGATNNRVTGNFIGLDISGTAALGNNNAGVVLYGGSQRNIIGPDNTIARNGTDGVTIYGSTCLSNTITLNSIYGNTDLGIDLIAGANDDILPPVVIYTDTHDGVAVGTACAGCRVEVFSDAGDEGRWYEGAVTATATGIWSLTKGSAFVGPNVQATATDVAGNTSEFSGLPPVVRSVSPTGTVRGTSDLGVTISGDHFRENEPLTADFGAGVTVRSTQFISRMQVIVYLDVAPSATLGPRNVTVTNYDGQSGTLPRGFTIMATSPFLPPVINSITPTIGLQGKRMDLTIHGQNFVDRPTVVFSGRDVIVNSVTTSSPTELLVNIVISDTAPVGLHDLTVANPDGQSDALTRAFEVQVRLFTDVSFWVGIGTWGQRGIAWGDYDNDGYVDLYVTNNNVLYHNNGDGTFTDATATAGGLWWGGEGAAWGDYDNDGDLDLYTSDWGNGDSLYRNEGNGTFTRVTAQAGVQDPGHGQSIAWGDYDDDGNLDLYVTNSGDPNHLFRNGGNGTFSDVTAQAQVADASGGCGVAWGNYDNDGDMDLYVTGSGVNHLFQNQGNGTFVDRAVELGITAQAYGGGCGVAWGDYDNDGDLDLAISVGGTAVLFRNDGATFTDVTTSARVGSAGIGGVGVAWADYDNDGWLDLYVTSDMDSALYRNNGNGIFADVTNAAGVSSGSGNWGAAWGDYDNDGDLDLFVVEGGLPESGQPDLPDILYRNNGNRNHWLHVKTVGTLSNRAGVGARVRVIAGSLSQIREVSGGSGRTSQDSLPVEFGLGTYMGTVKVEITWPSGLVNTFTGVAVDQAITLRESYRVYLPIVLRR